MIRSISPVRPALDIDDLDRAISRLSTRINAATYELLVLIRQFDERAGWLKWGFLNCVDWLHWRCDLSLGATREAFAYPEARPRSWRDDDHVGVADRGGRTDR